MAFIVHQGGDRFLLQSPEMATFIGLMLLPIPGESPQSFAYNFGSTYNRKELLNVSDFPELADVEFLRLNIQVSPILTAFYIVQIGNLCIIFFMRRRKRLATTLHAKNLLPTLLQLCGNISRLILQDCGRFPLLVYG